MNIIICGAGAIGSYYAWRLKRGGHRVILAARSTRLEEIRDNGIHLEDGNTEKTFHTDIPAAGSIGEALELHGVGGGDGLWDIDLIIVAVRAHQVPIVLGELEGVLQNDPGGSGEDSRRSPFIMFMGNFLSGLERIEQNIGTGRVLFGFPGVSAVVEEDGVVLFVDRDGRGEDEEWGITGGSMNEEIMPGAGLVCKAFTHSGVPVTRADSMKDVFFSQLVLRLPVLAALRIAGGTLDGLSKRNDLLKPMVKAVREGLALLREFRLKPVPDTLGMYARVPIFVVVNSMKRGFRTASSIVGIEKFGMLSEEESVFLAGELLSLCAEKRLLAKNIEFLFRYGFFGDKN